jgi:hypothetical protein
MLRTAVTIALMNATAGGAVTHPQPLIVTPGIIELPNHKRKALNRNEPIPKVMTRKRSSHLSTRGHRRKIKNADKSVKTIADKKLLI